MRACICLTACVSTKYYDETEAKKRLKIYLKVIQHWLKHTKFDVYIVDSSGYEFSEITHERFHPCSFVFNTVGAYLGKSIAECESMVYLYQTFKKEWKDKKYHHIIKITGRYYLKDLEKWTKHRNQKYLAKNIDIWLQQDMKNFLNSVANIFYPRISSEIYIIRPELIYDLFRNKYNPKNIIEYQLYKIMRSEKYNVMRLPLFKNTLKTFKGDGKTYLEYL